MSRWPVESDMARLTDYRKKRDFAITAEPSGKLGGRPAGKSEKARRFVVQRHDARRLHYDFRIALDGVYKSWAVTKLPSADPAVKRLAVEVEDHPLDYGVFEGVIPKGQYGGGTVQLWDRGTWRPQSDADPLKDLKAGHLKIELDGERMKGGWALIRMRDKAAANGWTLARPGKKVRHNWLLIKEKDEHATPGEEGALKAETSVKTGRTLEEIAAGKPKVQKPNRAGKSGKSPLQKKTPQESRREHRAQALLASPQPLKSARPSRVGAIPDFVPPQLARLTPGPPMGPAWVHEVKFDGYRLQMRVADGKAVLRTRKGLDWTYRFPEIAASGNALPDCLIDGEIVALDGKGHSDFGGLQTALSQGKTAGLVYFLFDCLFDGKEDIRKLALPERKERLKALLAKSDERLRYSEHFTADGKSVLDAACRMDLEGIVSKRASAGYQSGRTDAWTKSKCRGGQEIIIAGWWGDARTLRSLMMGAYRGNDLVYLGNVGTGFGQGIAQDLLKRLRPLERKEPAFRDSRAVKRRSGIHWVEPRLVGEVEYDNITGDGLMRHAAFKGIRLDKSAKSVVPEFLSQTENAMPKKNAARAKTPPARNNGRTEVAGIGIGNPDKELWPKSAKTRAVTKLDLARYYEKAASHMLPHIASRPISIVRAPDGIEGEKFFQRHTLKGAAAPLLAIEVKGEKQPYLGIDSEQALVALGQAGVLEIHPWGAKKDDPETPERIVFDLDPAPDVPFARVMDGAKEMKTRLEKLGFTPFLKTTGGKGLHVVIAVKGTPKKPIGWPDAKAFAKAVCEAMAKDAPTRYTTTLSKAARGGKIFLDYLRNDRTATAVAPYSPRAREGATVAMPLPWSALKAGFDPKVFTILSADKWLKRPDVWKDMARSAKTLP